MRKYGLMSITVLAISVGACGGKPPEAPVAPPPAPVVEAAPAPAPAPAAATTLIADFTSSERKNALGGEFGAWASGKPAPEGKCVEQIADGAWKISYDISVPGSYSGTWLRLANYDATAAKNLVLTVRGEGEFTSDMIVELKTGEGAAQKVSRHILRGITKDFARISIPLSSFKELTELKPLYELAFVFDEQTCPVKKGTIAVDSIELE